MNPMLSVLDWEGFQTAETNLGKRIYPIGVAHGGDYMTLVIDEDGRVYTFTDILEPFASDIYEAVRLLTSRG